MRSAGQRDERLVYIALLAGIYEICRAKHCPDYSSSFFLPPCIGPEAYHLTYLLSQETGLGLHDQLLRCTLPNGGENHFHWGPARMKVLWSCTLISLRATLLSRERKQETICSIVNRFNMPLALVLQTECSAKPTLIRVEKCCASFFPRFPLLY